MSKVISKNNKNSNSNIETYISRANTKEQAYQKNVDKILFNKGKDFIISNKNIISCEYKNLPDILEYECILKLETEKTNFGSLLESVKNKLNLEK